MKYFNKIGRIVIRKQKGGLMSIDKIKFLEELSVYDLENRIKVLQKSREDKTDLELIQKILIDKLLGYSL